MASNKKPRDFRMRDLRGLSEANKTERLYIDAGLDFKKCDIHYNYLET